MNRRRWYRLLNLFFGREPVKESVATRIHFNAGPDAVWNQMIFYEEVPGPPPWPLRLFLPLPVRTEGDKRAVGATILCTYNRGDVIKRITTVEAPRLVRFEVIRQQLGIEDCFVAESGSYEIHSAGNGFDIELTTNYRSHLRPRRLWRPVEKFLTRRLHRHILGAMGAALSHEAEPGAAPAGNPEPGRNASGGTACTPSPSHSRR